MHFVSCGVIEESSSRNVAPLDFVAFMQCKRCSAGLCEGRIHSKSSQLVPTGYVFTDYTHDRRVKVLKYDYHSMCTNFCHHS